MAKKVDAGSKSAKMTSAKDEARASANGGFNPVVFFKETQQEFNKVVWPSRQQLISESFAVVLMVTLSATLVYLADNFFVWMADRIF